MTLLQKARDGRIRALAVARAKYNFASTEVVDRSGPQPERPEILQSYVAQPGKAEIRLNMMS